MNHTPGPWMATQFGDVMPQGANYLVASCGGNSGPYRNYQANARLIAAAPELLEACRDAKALLIHDLEEPERTVFWKLVEAINKATGSAEG